MPEVTQLLSQEMRLELQLRRLSPKLMFVITVPVSDLIRPGVLQREKKKKRSRQSIFISVYRPPFFLGRVQKAKYCHTDCKRDQVSDLSEALPVFPMLPLHNYSLYSLRIILLDNGL